MCVVQLAFCSTVGRLTFQYSDHLSFWTLGLTWMAMRATDFSSAETIRPISAQCKQNIKSEDSTRGMRQ